MTYLSGVSPWLQAPLQRFAFVPRAVDPSERFGDVSFERLARAHGVGFPLTAIDLRPEGQAFGRVLRVLGPGEERAAEEEADPAAEEPGLVVAVHHDVDERRSLVVGPLDAKGTHDRPLDAHARVPVDVALDVLGDVGGELAAVSDLALVEGDGGHRPRLCATRRSAA